MTQSTSSQQCHTHEHRGYSSHKEDYLKRLRRIEGQTRGIQRMVETDQGCIDVLTQISAINKALRAVALGLVHDHIGTCVIAAAQAGDDELETRIDEVILAMSRFLK